MTQPTKKKRSGKKRSTKKPTTPRFGAFSVPKDVKIKDTGVVDGGESEWCEGDGYEEIGGIERAKDGA